MKGKTRKLLLNESVKNLGRVGDVVEVSAGYARNFLVPHAIAVEPTPNNLKKVEERKKEVERLEKEKRAQQEKLIKKLEGVELTIVRRANEQGHLFGSVGASDIARAMKDAGHDVEAEDISLHAKIDHIDVYTATVSFADDLKADIKVYVSPDQDSKAAMETYAKEHRAAEAAADAQAH
ncbi:MAG: 50S ribosomal protein L9 [Tepidisphaeraceae bacterium]